MFSLKKLNLKSLHSFFFAPKQAFTLVELIVVISVLAVLATISFSQVGNITKNARDASRTTSISNIKWSLEIFYAQKGRYPFPDNPTTLTWAWNSKLYKGTITTAVLPWLNTDTKDPSTNAPYQYATLWNTHYQIGTNLEGTTSFNQNLTNQVLAESTSTNTIPYIKWNYTFDPSLPSLFPIGTSSGIFSPSTCFILESSDSPNNFSSTASDCTTKANLPIKNADSALLGYWDMETMTGTLLRDLSGNENHGTFNGSMDYATALTGATVGKGLNFNGTTNFIYFNDVNSLKPTGAFSLSALATPNNTENMSALFRKRLYGYGLIFSGSTPMFFMYEGMTPNNLAKGNIRLSPGNTYLFTGVYSGDSVKIYVNGQLQGSRSTAGGAVLYYATGGIAIGKDGDGTTQFFSGSIDEVKLYGRPLSTEEVLQQAKAAGF